MDREKLMIKVIKQDKFIGKPLRRTLLRPFQVLDYIYNKLTTRSGNVKSMVVKTFWGEKMIVVFPEPVSISINYNGFFERDIVLYLLKILKQGVIFIDIGSHFGFITLLASRLVGSTGHVYSFEPTPSTYEILIQNTAKHTNISIFRKAIHDSEMELHFNDFGVTYSAYNSFTNPRSSKIKKSTIIRVETITLDSFVEEKNIIPQIIKIDTESTEILVLKGAVNLLKKYHPEIILEVGDFNIEGVPKSKEIIEFLVSLGYNPYTIEFGEKKEHRVMNNYGPMNLLFSRNDNIDN